VERGDLPEAVRGPDERIEPFEPERIARSLFAATERLGRPDAFLARELTDGVLHFLTPDMVGAVTTPDQITEVVTKVVREFGHPTLASTYEHLCSPPRPVPEGPPRRVALTTVPRWARPSASPATVLHGAAGEVLESFSLSHLFPRDLVSAHREGLIRIAGLATPFELAGVATDVPPRDILQSLRRARAVAGEFLALDSPEFDLAGLPGDPSQLAETFIRETVAAAEVLGLTIILNLNTATPPPRVAGGAGPLFQAPATRTDRHDQIALELARRANGPVQVWWHLTPDQADKQAVISSQLNGASTEFVFDRHGSAILLGPGMDRESPAALVAVGVNLARLVDMSGGPPVAADVFLRRLQSLARFAKTAGHVKHDYLRRYARPGIREAFLLDRASLVLVPLGLDVAADATDIAPAQFACDILKTLRTAAELDRPRLLPVRIDSPLTDGEWAAPADPACSIRHQVKRGSQWHAVTGAGRLDLVTTADAAADRVAALRAAAESAVVRLRFQPPGNGSRRPE